MEYQISFLSMLLSMFRFDSVQKLMISVKCLEFAWFEGDIRQKKISSRFMETFWQIVDCFGKLFEAMTFFELRDYKAYPEKHS
jgi:hypothetical protein